MTPEIQKAVEKLHEVLKEELGSNAVSVLILEISKRKTASKISTFDNFYGAGGGFGIGGADKGFCDKCLRSERRVQISSNSSIDDIISGLLSFSASLNSQRKQDIG